jgi:hypothetical protein
VPPEDVDVKKSNLLCVLDHGQQHTGRAGDKSGYVATSKPDSGAGISAPANNGDFRRGTRRL